MIQIVYDYDIRSRTTRLCSGLEIHPRKFTWNPKMEVWKMIFLFNWVICRFHMNFAGGYHLLWVKTNMWSHHLYQKFNSPKFGCSELAILDGISALECGGVPLEPWGLWCWWSPNIALCTVTWLYGEDLDTLFFRSFYCWVSFGSCSFSSLDLFAK